jgi:hypothetical protein
LPGSGGTVTEINRLNMVNPNLPINLLNELAARKTIDFNIRPLIYLKKEVSRLLAFTPRRLAEQDVRASEASATNSEAAQKDHQGHQGKGIEAIPQGKGCDRNGDLRGYPWKGIGGRPPEPPLLPARSHMRSAAQTLSAAAAGYGGGWRGRERRISSSCTRMFYTGAPP